jgi:hypothetical protein
MLDVLRPDGLLSLRFEFSNLVVRAGRKPGWLAKIFGAQATPPRLVRLDPERPALVIVHFPPQHIAEEAVFEDSSGNYAVLPLDPLRSTLSGPSRLAFRLPKGVDESPLHFQGFQIQTVQTLAPQQRFNIP